MWLPSAYADEAQTLPTIKVMADAELRDEVVTMAPLQDDKNVRKALQHKIVKSEQDIQNTVYQDTVKTIDFQPKTEPDMSKIDPALRAYVLTVAAGLQSSDPTSGIFTMLQPLGIDRSAAANAVTNGGTLKFNIDSNAMQKLFGDQWQNNIPNNVLPR